MMQAGRQRWPVCNERLRFFVYHQAVAKCGGLLPPLHAGTAGRFQAVMPVSFVDNDPNYGAPTTPTPVPTLSDRGEGFPESASLGE